MFELVKVNIHGVPCWRTAVDENKQKLISMADETSTRSADTFGSFRRCLKSELFAAAYDTKALRALLIRFATRRYTNLSSIVQTTVLLKSLECYKNTQMKAKHHTSNLLAVVCGTMCLQAACKLFAYRTPLSWRHSAIYYSTCTLTSTALDLWT